ncbi:MAG: hypothetical protein IPM13_07395 [Phycisphaerales bacterium]|nr:hypothetical protein [Phycisphaerales bacterium]
MSPDREVPVVAQARAPHATLLVNLLLPGAGAILSGSIGLGLGAGLVFALCANLAILTTLILPDDFTRFAAWTTVALAIASYGLAQVTFAVAHQRGIEIDRASRRRDGLRTLHAAVERGEHATALELVERLAAEWPDDLALLDWRVRLLRELGRAEDASRAEAELRRLDRHGIYARGAAPAAPRAGADGSHA